MSFQDANFIFCYHFLPPFNWSLELTWIYDQGHSVKPIPSFILFPYRFRFHPFMISSKFTIRLLDNTDLFMALNHHYSFNESENKTEWTPSTNWASRKHYLTNERQFQTAYLSFFLSMNSIFVLSLLLSLGFSLPITNLLQLMKERKTIPSAGIASIADGAPGEELWHGWRIVCGTYSSGCIDSGLRSLSFPDVMNSYGGDHHS